MIVRTLPIRTTFTHWTTTIGYWLVRLQQLWLQPGASPFQTAKRRLIVMNLVVVSTILAIMAVAVYTTDAYAIDSQINQQLVSTATRESYHVLSPRPASPTPSADGDHPVYVASSPNVFFRTFDSQGNLLEDYAGVTTLDHFSGPSILPLLQGKSTTLFTQSGTDSEHFRLYTVPVSVNGIIIGAIQSGISLHTREQQLHDLILTLVLVSLGALVLTVAAGVYLAERALVPIRAAYSRQRQFVAAASHELRTPLAFVRSQADILERQAKRLPAPTNVSMQTDIADIQHEIDYMTTLIRDLLFLARGDDEPVKQLHEPVDLAPILDNLTRSFSEMAQTHSLELTYTNMTNGPLLVAGDPGRLRQIFVVLLDNAIQYTQSGGTIAVEASLDTIARQLRIRVRDTGIGMTAEQQEEIFEPFFRVDASRRREDGHESTGLGLAIARQLAIAYSGTLMVHSAIGVGSTFTVSFTPIAQL